MAEKTNEKPVSSEGSPVRSVLANWAGEFVFIVSGFILPRLINDQIGQAQLGIWDFCWATVAYLTLLSAGLASSVNRYVAWYKAVGRWNDLNRACSACACIFTAGGLVAVAITGVLAVGLPSFLPKAFAEFQSEVQWVLLFLGLSTAVMMWAAVYHGVISGYQRYDLAVAIETGCHVAFVLATVGLLFLGYGLRQMAVAVLVSKALEAGAKCLCAHRVCPQLSLSVRRVTLEAFREVVAFGAKTFVGQIASLVTYPGNSLVVGFFLGPASLAVYARAMGLLRHANTGLFQFARVLIPMVSESHAKQDEAEISRLVLVGTRYSLLLAVPLVMALAIMADPLMRLWMGKAYATTSLLPVLALGSLLPLVFIAPRMVLQGMNRHGLPELGNLLAGVASIGLNIVLLSVFDMGLVGVAVCVGLCLSLANLVITPVMVARQAKLPLGQFLRVIPGPVALTLPFGVWLLLCRYLWNQHDLIALAAGLGGGSVILLLMYWRSGLPKPLKLKILSMLPLAGNRLPPEKAARDEVL